MLWKVLWLELKRTDLTKKINLSSNMSLWRGECRIQKRNNSQRQQNQPTCPPAGNPLWARGAASCFPGDDETCLYISHRKTPGQAAAPCPGPWGEQWPCGMEDPGVQRPWCWILDPKDEWGQHPCQEGQMTTAKEWGQAGIVAAQEGLFLMISGNRRAQTCFQEAKALLQIPPHLWTLCTCWFWQ